MTRIAAVRPNHYKLIGHDPVPCELMQWAKWFEYAARTVARDVFKSDAGEDVTVSTVFLGLDHNHAGFGEPILFETIVFGGVLDQWHWRYCTWEEAEAGHAQLINLARVSELATAGEDAKQDAARIAGQVLARWSGKA